MKPLNRFYKVGFFTLLLLNLVLAFLLLKPFRHGHSNPPGSAMIVERLEKELQLSPEQVDSFKLYFMALDQEREHTHQKRDSSRAVMIECLRSEKQCDSLFLEGSSSTFYKHHKRVLKVLTADQKTRYLDDLLNHKKDFKGPK